jgi:hypothetical protein
MAARAGDIDFVVSGVNSSLHFVTRGSFREFQYTRNTNPRELTAHGGRLALEIPEAFNQRKRQPVHRNVIPPLSGIGYFRGATSTVGHLSRSIATFHFAGPPPFSVIPISLHVVRRLSIWISIAL